jgi:membrane glycosyltransferase
VRRFILVTALLAVAVWAAWVILGVVASGSAIGPTAATLDEGFAFLYGFISFLVVWLLAIGIWALVVFRRYLRDDRRIPLAGSKPDQLR